MPKEKVITIRLIPTGRTDLFCIYCGGFKTDYAVAAGGNDMHSHVGVHTGQCLNSVKAKRKSKEATP